MKDFVARQQANGEKKAQIRAALAEDRKLGCKPTRTSIIRAINSKRTAADILESTAQDYSSARQKLKKRNNTALRDLMAASNRIEDSDFGGNNSQSRSNILPPIKRQGPPSRASHQSQTRLSRRTAGTNAQSVQKLGVAGIKSMTYDGERKERALMPTYIKESFLQRNAHMANAKMNEMANNFARNALANMK